MKLMMPLSSRIIFTTLSILLPVGAHLADYNKTHIFNQLWTPHAKFHDAQTLIFSVLLGILTIFFAWRKTTDRLATVLATSSFAAIYWIAQAGAILYHGTAAYDPEFITPTSYLLGLPQQTYIELFSLVLAGVAVWLALKPNAKWVA